MLYVFVSFLDCEREFSSVSSIQYNRVVVSCVFHAFASAHCCLVVICWKRADLLALPYDVYCILVTFPCGILDQVWYLIVPFPELCRLSYFAHCFCFLSQMHL